MLKIDSSTDASTYSTKQQHPLVCTTLRFQEFGFTIPTSCFNCIFDITSFASRNYTNTHGSNLSAHIQTRNRRVMVGNLRVELGPRVDVDVLVLDLLCERLRHKHVVELLRVHVEEVRVALELLDLCGGVGVDEARDGDVLLKGLDEGELRGVLVMGKW
jgi:hypothetical protein